MNTIEKMIPFAAAAMATSIHAGPNTSKLWEDYSSARLTGSVPELADFSYVGYHSGERSIPDPGWKVFDVTDFGAVPDDGKSDKEAVVKAIAAAEENGSGIVYFPAGRFRINDISDPHNEPIRITSSHIILRGSGSGANGTELFMERHMDPSDPKKLWTCLYVIDISGRGGVDVSSKVTSNSRRETFSVRVARPSSFREGDWVELIYKDNSPEAVAAATAPYEPDAAWKSIINDGVEVYEIHRIHTISGNRLTFKEPIHSDINADWKVRKLSMLEEIGVEDIAFVGNWHEEFVHHKNPIHDGGWSCLKMSNCVNSWVRDCRFTDMNRPVSVAGSAAITIQDVLLNGTLGHSAISLNGTCHSLVQRIKDTAGHWHANGVAGTCSGNVFLRSEYSREIRKNGGRGGGGIPFHQARQRLWKDCHALCRRFPWQSTRVGESGNQGIGVKWKTCVSRIPLRGTVSVAQIT